MMKSDTHLAITPDPLTPAEEKSIAAFYGSQSYKNMQQHCGELRITPKRYGGVYCEEFTPAGGIAEDHQAQVLINLHGGGFVSGARTVSHLESMPIAAKGRYRVVSVDYRQCPAYTFPAATDDILAVYQALLQDYTPKQIGVFGCSAGATLAAQLMARLQAHALPLPGGLVMSCSAAGRWDRGDSWDAHLAEPGDNKVPTAEANPYFKGADLTCEQVFPSASSHCLAAFPPTLLASATRDFALSSVLVSHADLKRLGVPAELSVWDGVGHGFIYTPSLEASQDFYAQTVAHFERYLL